MYHFTLFTFMSDKCLYMSNQGYFALVIHLCGKNKKGKINPYLTKECNNGGDINWSNSTT